MLRPLLITLFLCLRCIQAHALDITVGLDNWTNEISGGIEAPKYFGGYYLSLENFDTKEEDALSLEVRIEHEHKVLPKVLLSYMQQEHSGPGFLEVGGNTYNITQGKVDPAFSDLSAYYTVFDQQILNIKTQLDVGLTARIIDGDLSLLVDGGNAPLKSSLSTELALLYTHFKLIPIKNLSLHAESLYGDIGDESSRDIKLFATLHLQQLGLRAGYRFIETDIKSEFPGFTVYSNLEYEGYFFGANYHF